MYPITTAWRMRKRRQMLKMTLAEVAEAASVSTSLVSSIEREVVEAPTYSTRRGLCKALRCDARWLFEGNIDHAPAGFYTPFCKHPDEAK